jgi:hypothetical protein
VGLSKTDAILNLQANGDEYKAAGVTTTRNPDGTITVTVDLGYIPAATVANLSFDLIGFGRAEAAESSRATLRSLRLGETPDDPDDPGNPDRGLTAQEKGNRVESSLSSCPGTATPGASNRVF